MTWDKLWGSICWSDMKLKGNKRRGQSILFFFSFPNRLLIQYLVDTSPLSLCPDTSHSHTTSILPTSGTLSGL